MNVIGIILGLIISLMCLGSAIADFKKDPRIVESVTHLGFPASQIPLLGAIKLVGIVGIVVGFWIQPLGVAAAIGLALYFLCAIVLHVRAKETFKQFAPAFLLFVLSVLQTLVTIAR